MNAKHVRCLWTWPFGHKWVKTVNQETFLVCTRCGKEEDTGKTQLWGIGGGDY
jgi:hypothetical protein